MLTMGKYRLQLSLLKEEAQTPKPQSGYCRERQTRGTVAPSAESVTPFLCPFPGEHSAMLSLQTGAMSSKPNHNESQNHRTAQAGRGLNRSPSPTSPGKGSLDETAHTHLENLQ